MKLKGYLLTPTYTAYKHIHPLARNQEVKIAGPFKLTVTIYIRLGGDLLSMRY